MDQPSETTHSPQDLAGLDPAGVLRGALGGVSASWPAEGPIQWSPPDNESAAALFPGYTEISLLGRGGMGAVYTARQVSLGRRVALKLLPEELSRDPAAAVRFQREAQALAKLNHPNIVGIYDFGETASGSFFFVMEYVEGANLQQLIHRGELPLGRALDVVRQVCDALEYAHQQGFVHRDIKPANILVDAEGRVKVSDFGLAMFLQDDAPQETMPSPTMTRGIVGTPEYIAPEQRRGDRAVDHRADIYSLGVMLYEMLTGRIPYGAFEPPSHRSEVDKKMDRVVLRAMQEEPEKRYQHAGEVRQEVQKAAVNQRFSLGAKVAVMVLLLGSLAAFAAWKWSGISTAGSVVQQVSTPVQLGEFSFVPAGDTGVSLSVNETSRGEFAKFVEVTGYLSAGSIQRLEDGQWKQENGSWESPPGLENQTSEHPVTCVSYHDATAYCEWLTTRERTAGRLGANDRFRLPTAEEWRAAAGISMPALRSLQFSAAPEVIVEIPGPAELEKASVATVQQLDGSVSEWTSSAGPRPDTFIVCGACWVEGKVPKGASAIRAYEGNLRGVGLGFRIALERKSLSHKP